MNLIPNSSSHPSTPATCEPAGPESAGQESAGQESAAQDLAGREPQEDPRGLSAALVLTGAFGQQPLGACVIDLHPWAVACPEHVLADYLYDAGHTFGAELASEALPWLATLTGSPADLVRRYQQGPAAEVGLEVIVNAEALATWLGQHRLSVLLLVRAAEATLSSSWIYDHDLRRRLLHISEPHLSSMVMVLTAMEPDGRADPEQTLAAVHASIVQRTPHVRGEGARQRS